MTIDDEVALPTGRSQLDLISAQLEAIDAWNRARRVTEAAAVSVALTRELRLDLSRRMEARRREQDALVARAEQSLRESGDLMAGWVRTRAVVAHRNDWFRDTVADRLTRLGVVVVGAFGDGADAAGTVVAEQPDLVLVEDRLPTLTGLDVVRRVRTFAPDAVVGAQCLDGSGIEALIEAGAQAVFTRRVPPDEIAHALLGCLSRGGDPVAIA